MTKAWVEYGSGSTLDLDSYEDAGGGVQVVRGLTGAGLPGITSQWAEGVGDGATFRNDRVLAREMDLPLEVRAPDRPALRNLIEQVSLAFAGNFTLWYEDDNATDRWYIKGRRVGGGNPTLGVDTNGVTVAAMVVSVKCGDPYWTRDTTVTENWDDAGIVTPITVDNPGTAKVYPKWKLRGPMLGFTATSPDGDSFSYGDYIPDGKEVVIDCAAGTVRQGGDNRYPGMAPAPKFFALPPGETEIDIVVDRASSDFTTRRGAGRVNHFLNPNTTSNTGWYGTTLPIASGGRLNMLSTASGGTRRVQGIYLTHGLGPGVPLVFKVRIYKEEAIPSAASNPVLTLKSGDSYVSRVWPNLKNPAMAVGEYLDIEIPTTTDNEDSVTFEIKQAWHDKKEQGYACSWTNLYLGEPGTFFSGATPDTAQFDYSWLGTANASKSTEVEVAGLALSQVQVSFSPKDWMVI